MSKTYTESTTLPACRVRLMLAELDDLLNTMTRDFPESDSGYRVAFTVSLRTVTISENTSEAFIKAVATVARPLRNLSVTVASIDGPTEIALYLSSRAARLSTRGDNLAWVANKPAEIVNWFSARRRWYAGLRWLTPAYYATIILLPLITYIAVKPDKNQRKASKKDVDKALTSYSCGTLSGMIAALAPHFLSLMFPRATITD